MLIMLKNEIQSLKKDVNFLLLIGGFLIYGENKNKNVKIFKGT